MTSTRTDDSAAISKVFADQYEAWAAGDADRFVADYCEHATVIMPGAYRRSREEIRQGMAAGFAGPLKDSSVIDTIEDLRFLDADHAIAVSKAGIRFAGETDVPADRLVHATWVLQRQNDRWLVAAYHNSPATSH
ncbi:SgcJ/EcaC family oxidoreductase [Nocardia jejuensis]|uniref:SgcJ/EcaC family oxidoreductase n=1 Tax=Nocardia jejuensis TaxID=328049 RepID=UPI00082D399D|nr:SgcJ/EcaC family oxidoreductase [Nocardia jejuensis]